MIESQLFQEQLDEYFLGTELSNNREYERIQIRDKKNQMQKKLKTACTCRHLWQLQISSDLLDWSSTQVIKLSQKFTNFYRKMQAMSRYDEAKEEYITKRRTLNTLGNLLPTAK